MVSYYASLSLSLGSLARLPLPKVPYGQKGLDHFETQTERYWALGVCVCVWPRHSQSICTKGGKQTEWGAGWSPGEEKVKALCGKRVGDKGALSILEEWEGKRARHFYHAI